MPPHHVFGHRLLALSLVLLTAILMGIGSRAVDQKTAQPRTHTIAIRNFQFAPPTLEVNSGDTVIWRNQDIVPHIVTADKFESKSMDQGESWTYTAK